MKRIEALAPLSRDHHGSLILAQLMKKDAPVYSGMPVASTEKAKYAQQQFETHIKKHFLQEETILEKVKDAHEAIRPVAREIKKEHQQLTGLFHGLSSAGDLEEALDVLANTLEKHIRKEERILFPMLQQHCSPELLQEIHTLLH